MLSETGERRTDETPIERTDTTFADRLGVEWQFRRYPDRERYETGPDGLGLRGGPETLDEPGVTFVGRRQTGFDCRTEATLIFDPGRREEAGLAIVADDRHHDQLGVTRRDGRREAVARLRIGDATDVIGRTPVGTTTDLAIAADAEEYRFLADGERLGAAATRYLATEVAAGFTGVVVGPYATGRGKTCTRPRLSSASSTNPEQPPRSTGSGSPAEWALEKRTRCRWVSSTTVPVEGRPFGKRDGRCRI
ncbi:hypothetical protein ACFQMA_04385 [Halosimplex aquaticum]|uniref:Beta-xylosidase C-terminal Concanavalin A-like domain-containing protein n=1 Tax=Halosimplex aquaticum TaxID=3026162 RepID=A0ABD5Y080_9EURY|nr:hypothetical protein [Halosimplex aquaticum]